MQINTERLLLREIDHQDTKDIQEYATDLEVIKYLTFGPNTLEDTKNFIEQCINNQKENPRRNYDLGITLPTINKLIGGCGIRVSDPRNSTGDIGYCLNRSYWGKGYATEAAIGLLGFGFKDLMLHRIYAHVDPENVASIRVLEKLGMRYEGHLRQNLLIHDEFRDTHLYAILKEEWKETNRSARILI
jgi:RimJ/RimL family protein N-acetyltransferase